MSTFYVTIIYILLVFIKHVSNSQVDILKQQKKNAKENMVYKAHFLYFL